MSTPPPHGPTPNGHQSPAQQSSTTPPALPDFASGGIEPRSPGSASNARSSAYGTASALNGEQLNARTEKRSNRGLIAGIVGGGIVVIVALGLFVSQVVMRSIEQEPLAQPTGTEHVNTQGDPSKREETWLPERPQDPPPEIFTQAPTSDCTMSQQYEQFAQPTGYVRGGGLQFTIPAAWDHPWNTENVPYLFNTGGYGRHVEGHWYSAITVGRVDWPQAEGPYPGTEQMAVTMFQCYATHFNVIQQFGDHPTVTNYRSEATTVDGTPAWIVQATYHFDPNARGPHLQSTTASVVTSIVVETPQGPSALVSDVAADYPDHVKGLESAIASLTVIE